MFSLSAIANILFVALSGASLANLYDDCLQEGMIFAKFGAFIKDKFWLKPLGGCLICTNVWVTLLVGIIYFLSPVLFFAISIVGISNSILKFIIK